MALIEIAIEELAKGIVLIPMIEKNDPRYPVDDPGVKEIFFGGRNPGEVFNGLNLKKYEIQGFNFRSHEKKLELINYLFKVYKEIIPKLSPLLDLGLFTKKIKAEKEYERIKENLVNSNKFIENILSDTTDIDIANMDEIKQIGFYVDIEGAASKAPWETKVNQMPVLKIFIVLYFILNLWVNIHKGEKIMNLLENRDKLLGIFSMILKEQAGNKDEGEVGERP